MQIRFIFQLATLSVLLFTGSSCANRLTAYQNLLVGESAEGSGNPSSGELSVTYLGVNGYLLRSGTTSLLVDPYLTRINLREAMLNAPVKSSPEAISFARRQANLPDRIDGYLVTHSHFDHLFDVPDLQKVLGGKVVVSSTGAFLCEASGVARSALLPSVPGDVHRIGNATIRVLSAEHDRVLGKIPYPGEITAPLAGPPQRPKDWRLGTPLAFLIEMGGSRVYIESGGVSGSPPPVSDVDLAIVGTAVRDSQVRYSEAVRALSPRFVLPTHQDNFFSPLESGFHFSTLSNFPRVFAEHRGGNLPGRLVLMDYFHTWTLPGAGKAPVSRPETVDSVFGTVKAWIRGWFVRSER